MSWTQPICRHCFAERNPGREPVRVHFDGEPFAIESCVYCGNLTTDGIYVRVDPRELKS